MCVPLAGSAGGGRRGEEAVAGRERDAEGVDEEGGGPPRLGAGGEGERGGRIQEGREAAEPEGGRGREEGAPCRRR